VFGRSKALQFEVFSQMRRSDSAPEASEFLLLAEGVAIYSVISSGYGTLANMDPDFSFIDLNHFGPPAELTDVVPSVILQPPPASIVLPGHNTTAPPPTRAPNRAGNRQTNRRKYTDEEVQQICSMKEAGMPWR
jgi:hypothetical protein